MTEHKASAEQWAQVEGESCHSPRCSCLMELRARVEALEARVSELQTCHNTTADALLELRAARRPKPPSLKEQALEDLEQIDGYAVDQLSAYEIHGDLKRRVSNIRRALETLPE